MQAQMQQSAAQQLVVPDNETHIMWNRVWATIIDGIVIAALLWVLTKIFGTAQLLGSQPQPVAGVLFDPIGTMYGITNSVGGTMTWKIQLAPFWQMAVVFAYYVVLESFFGATPGKKFMKLRVVSCTGDKQYGRAPVWAVVVRNLLRFVDAIGPFPYVLGLISTKFSAKRQRLGDRFARTVVIREEAVPHLYTPLSQVLVGRRILWVMLLFLVCTALIFPYFGRKAMVISNEITLKHVLSTESIKYYKLEQPTWIGWEHIRYPIVMDTVRDKEGKLSLYACRGSIDLDWEWQSWDWVIKSTAIKECKEY